MKRVICIFLTCWIALSGTVFCFAADNPVNGCNWMSTVDDSASLADISMPGTHDTAATYLAFGIKARCQDKVIPAQLNLGVRFMDIRLCKDGDKLKLVHNFVDCRKGSGFGAPKLYLDDVIGYCSDFLSNNPKECIVLFVKEDFGSAADFDDILLGYISKNSSLWYTENRIPALGEVRGKIVLMNRFAKSDTKLTDANGGINLTNFPGQGDKEGTFQVAALSGFSGKMISTYTVQDRYNYSKEDKWNKGILPTLELEKTSGELLINFFSTAAGLAPEINAEYINQQALAYRFEHNKCYGAVLFDFVTPELAAKIYRCNASVQNTKDAPALGKPIDVPAAEHASIRFLDAFWHWLIQLFS